MTPTVIMFIKVSFIEFYLSDSIYSSFLVVLSGEMGVGKSNILQR